MRWLPLDFHRKSFLSSHNLSEADDHSFTFRGCDWPLSSMPFGQACFGWTVESCLKVEMAFEADV